MRTLEDIEAMNMLKKGLVEKVAGSDTRGQAIFVFNRFSGRGIDELTRRSFGSQNNLCNPTHAAAHAFVALESAVTTTLRNAHPTKPVKRLLTCGYWLYGDSRHALSFKNKSLRKSVYY